MKADLPHLPDRYSIEVFAGGRWHAGMHRPTAGDAIWVVNAWQRRDRLRYRVFDPEGNEIYDTAQPPALAYRPEDIPEMLASPIAQFLAEVHLEVTRARNLFPGDRIMTVALAEEFGEVCKAVLEEEPARVRAEAVQLAAMCVRLVLDGDGSVRDWRAERGLAPLGAFR